MMDLLKPAVDLFSFFEKTPDLVCLAGKDGFLKKVNPAVVSTLGYSTDELYSRPIESFIYEEDRMRTGQNRINLLNGQALHNFQNRYVTKDGHIIWLEWTSIYFPENEMVLALARNITPQKKSALETEEQFNKYKSLATHFKNSIEKDRKYLAYELHEELAQLAAGVKMEIETVSFLVPDLPEMAKNKLIHAANTAKLLIKTIQRLSFSISPAMLDQFGLDPTLQWLCREFTILTGQSCEFSSNYNESLLSEEEKTDFFRICQEALANVMLHSKATKTYISISETDEKIVLCIDDNGIGFDTTKKYSGAGIVNMYTRAASISGELEIISDAMKGTQVCVSIAKINR